MPGMPDARAGRPAAWLELWRALFRNARAARARAYVRVVATGRELSWAAFEVFLPVLAAAAYVYYYRALGAPPEYAGFVLLGGALTAYWLNVLWAMAMQFFWEKQEGQLEVFFLAPISRMSILAGMAAGGMVASTVRAIGTLVLGSWLFGVHIQADRPFLAVAAFLLTLVALYGLGMVMASVFMMYGRDAFNMMNLLQDPIYLASGFYFPVRALGRGVAIAASFIPLTLGLDAMRQLLFGLPAKGLFTPAAEVGALAGLSVAFLALAYLALTRMETLAKREGRLTVKWQ